MDAKIERPGIKLKPHAKRGRKEKATQIIIVFLSEKARKKLRKL